MKLINLDDQRFIVGSFKQVLLSIHNLALKKKSVIVFLACSLNDLALQDKKAAYKCVDICTNDSMLITFFLRLKIKQTVDRVYGPDLFKTILALENKRKSHHKHYFLASDVKVAKKIKVLIRKKLPNLIYEVGFLPREISVKEEIGYLRKIKKSDPDFIWIGIGSPKQVELADWLKKNVSGNYRIFCVGAAFNFYTGSKKQAPSFVRQSGLEWLYRLINEPTRLWKRYLVVIPEYLLKKTLETMR